MKKILLASIIFSALFISCSPTKQPISESNAQPALYPSLSIQEYFPLKDRAYWIYKGNVRWAIVDSSDVAEREITWKMEVQRVIQRNDIFGYEMLGAPWDLAWYEDGKEPSEYGIIQTGGNYYRTSITTVRRLLDESDFLGDLVDEYDVFLDIPLVSGKKFCDTPSLTRIDGKYCWIVGDAIQENRTDIKGLVSENTVFEFPIYNGTLSDHSIMHFIPGVGFSRYEYHHHGAVSDAEVRLIEYHSGE
jgi:hypothetical protein